MAQPTFEQATFGEAPPTGLLRFLRAQEIGPVRATIEGSLDFEGNPESSWVIVTDDEILVADADSLRVSRRFRNSGIERVVADPRVGSGMLQLVIDGRHVDLLRYGNQLAHHHRRAAEKITQFLHGESISVSADDLRDPRRCPTCGFRLGSAGERCPRCISRRGTLRRMLSMIRPYRGRAMVMLSLLLVGVALDLVSPQLTRYLVDNVLPGGPTEAEAVQNDPMLHQQLLQVLVIVVAVLASVQTARMIVNIVNGLIASRVGAALTYDVRRRLVGHLHQLGIEYFERQQAGALVGRVAYDTESIHDFVWQLTGGFILQLVMVVGVFVMMLTLDVQLALLALLPSPLVMGGTMFFWRIIYPRYYRFWDAASKQAGALNAMLRGIRVVKFFGQEKREMLRFDEISRRFSGYRRNVDGSIAVFNGAVGVLFQLGGWLVWYFGGREVLGRELSLGELMAFFGYMWMFYGPLAALPQLTSWLTQFATQSHRIFEVLDTPSSVRPPSHPAPRRRPRGAIEFRNVSFSYEAHKAAVREIDLRIEPGETIGVVGGSGSGKSTLISLLCRLYDVDEGQVCIDGVDVRDFAQSDLRHAIGVVPQETILFGGTIAENIAYGLPELEHRAILMAARAAQCHEFVLGHTLAYDTSLGENGTGLSGGERQRIGIARAIITDPPILVFDEATSNVDPQSEAAIQTGLERIGRKKTTIAVAHRMSALRNADRIIVLDHGRIAESGPPAQLARSGGRYATMLRLQGGERSVPLPRTPRAGGTPSVDERASTVTWLDPRDTRVRTDADGVLEVEVGRSRWTNVVAIDCFPATQPGHFISLSHRRDVDHTEEIGLIEDPNRWPRDERLLIAAALRRRILWHEVQRVVDVRLVNDLLQMIVDTQIGMLELTVKRGPQWAQDLPAGKLVIDMDDNHYFFPTRRLSREELRLLARYVDL
jgi:ATP-binding cassette, subfamily B, bacterial